MCGGKEELESTFVCGTGSRRVVCGENHGEREGKSARRNNKGLPVGRKNTSCREKVRDWLVHKVDSKEDKLWEGERQVPDPQSNSAG